MAFSTTNIKHMYIHTSISSFLIASNIHLIASWLSSCVPCTKREFLRYIYAIIFYAYRYNFYLFPNCVSKSDGKKGKTERLVLIFVNRCIQAVVKGPGFSKTEISNEA